MTNIPNDLRLVRVEPQPTWNGSRWVWPLPVRARFPNCCTEVVSASREWWEYAPSEAKPHPMAEAVMLRDEVWYWAIPTGWQPIETAKVNDLFAHSTWVLVHTDAGMVTEAMPHFMGNDGGYIWMTARGDNCRGSDNEHSRMLRRSVTHWMPLPDAPVSALDVSK